MTYSVDVPDHMPLVGKLPRPDLALLRASTLRISGPNYPRLRGPGDPKFERLGPGYDLLGLERV